MFLKTKTIVPLFTFLWVVQGAFAQNNYKQYLDLSYSEIDSVASISYQKGAYNKIILYYKAAQEKAKGDFGQQDSVFAEYTDNLAFSYNKIGQYNKALQLFEQAKNIHEKNVGKNHPDFAASLNNLAVLYYNIGDYDKALPLFIQCMNIEEKLLGKDHPDFAISLNNIAFLHQKMGNYDKALSLYLQAKNIREKALGKEHPSFAESLNNLALLYKSIGNYDKALPLYIQAKNIREKALGKEHPLFAQSLNNLGNLHKMMGNYDKALPLYLQAKSVWRKALGENHPEYSSALINLAGLYRIMEEYDKALLLSTQAKNIRAKVFGKAHPSFSLSLNNLAFLYKSMGNYDKAWEMLRQIVNSQSNLSLSSHFNNAWFDSLMTVSYSSNKHINEVLEALDHIYSLLEQDRSIENARAKQILVADLSNALLAKLRKQVSNEQDKLRMLAKSNYWLQKSLKVLYPKQQKQKAFNLSDQNKSVLLLQATKAEKAYRLGRLPDSLVWKDRRLLKKQSQLRAQLLEKRKAEEIDLLREELNRLNQDIDAFGQLIKKEYPKYHKFKYQEIETKVQDIQTLLDEQSALIEYVIGDSVVHIFCVTQSEIVWEKTFVATEQLTNYIDDLHQGLSDYPLIFKDKKTAYKLYTKPAHWFYQKLLAPVLKDKNNINNLIIVTDGELGHLPFESFLVEQAPQSLSDYKDLHYLIQDYSISYNYSATLWKENKQATPSKNNGQLLAMAANYDLKLDSSMTDVRLPTDQWLREKLSSLPAAREEVEMLQENFQGFFAFDTLASEKTVKAKAADYAVLHFAVHGILDKERPVLSSLTFSEDNDSLESNFWQAHEISKMDLNADLVVLSACETGYGKFEKGNGIASLARSFMYAGAPSLIVSLWQVNDKATSMIMQNLYQNLADGQAIDEALRQAKLDYIQSANGLTAHPAFWSPFIQIGKTEPVELKKKGTFMVWGIVMGVFVLVGMGGLAIRRKKKEVA